MHPGWPTPEEIALLAPRVPPLVRFGTSSWTYPEWQGLIYQLHYPTKSPAAKRLAEYARWPLARTVGIDSFLYDPPSEATLREYAEALPPRFQCVSKVWDRVTARRFSPRDHARGGQLNTDWLNAKLFVDEVLGPMREHFSQHLGPLVFELQAIEERDKGTPGQFVHALDQFLGALPTDSQYAVEVRNPEFLSPPYFTVLRQHGVAHVFNSWTRMPPVGEQLALHDSITADFIVARILNRPGRTFQQAVDAFRPYTHIQDENPKLRNDLVALARTAINLRIPAQVIIGNRVEGCSPLTIAAVARMLVDAIAA
jgi:uncharacterized protein YecE (DUF72 family)